MECFVSILFLLLVWEILLRYKIILCKENKVVDIREM